MSELLHEAAQTLVQRLSGPLKLNAPSQANLVKLLPFYLADHECWNDVGQFAYALATPYHETGKFQSIAGQRVMVRFAPISEVRAHPTKQAGLYAQQRRYWDTGYYGRGLVQITWRANYAKFESVTGKPLLTQPELALDLETSYLILREGMRKGLFTGKKLADFVHGEKRDFFNARRIINGTDKAAEIAAIAQTILTVLST